PRARQPAADPGCALKGEPRAEPGGGGALEDQEGGRHVLEGDPEVHADETLAVVAAAVLETGGHLPEIGVDLRDALEEDAAGAGAQELRRVVGEEPIGGGQRLRR